MASERSQGARIRPNFELGSERFERLPTRAGERDRGALSVQGARDCLAEPPEAPVTRAVLPVRSNIGVIPLVEFSGLRRGAKGGDVCRARRC